MTVFREPSVRHRWRGITATARSIDDAFALGPPMTFQLPLEFSPVVVRVQTAKERPDVRHVEIPRKRETLPPLLRGESGEALVAAMRARTSDEAVESSRSWASEVMNGPARENEASARAVALVLGCVPFRERWGEDATIDWLRARPLGTAIGAEPRWLGILSWLAARARHWSAVVFDADWPPLAIAAEFGALPLGVAALVQANGAAATMDALLVAERTHGGRDAAWRDARRRLLLRCALEGRFVPASLARLVPNPRAKEQPPEAWQTLLLARRALLDHGHVMGAAHLTAALLATDMRHAVARTLRERGAKARVPGWGSRPLQDREVEALRRAVYRPNTARKRWHLWSGPAWPDGWGGPDRTAAESALGNLLDGDPWMASEVLMHDGLAFAAVLAMGGHAANAMAALGSTRTPSSLAETRSGLARAIQRVKGPTMPPDRPTSPEAEAVYQQLRKLPDPSLAIDAPYWLLGDQRADLQHALQTSGRLQDFRNLRLLLDRADLAARLAPFWLLQEDADTEDRLCDLVRAIGTQGDPPTRDACLHFLKARL